MSLRDHYGEAIAFDGYSEHLWAQTAAPTPIVPHPADARALGWWPWHPPIGPAVVALETIEKAAKRVRINHRRLSALAAALGYSGSRFAPEVWDAIAATSPPSIVLPGCESARKAAARLGVGRGLLEHRSRGMSVRGGLLPSQWDALAAMRGAR